MDGRHERCFICNDPTHRAGEDSIYIGVSGIGPWCDSCYQDMVQEIEGDARAEERALAANAPPDPALLALARLGAWVAQSHADEPGDVFAPDIEDAEDKFGVVVTHRPPVGHCALGGERGDDCPCSEYFGRDEQCECRLFAPGIADAIARLLAPDGAGEVTVCRWPKQGADPRVTSCGKRIAFNLATDGETCPSCGGRIAEVSP